MTKEQAQREKNLDESIRRMCQAQLGRELARRERRIQSAKSRHADVLADYKSEEEINEAWGWGLIDTRKRDSLLKAFRETLPDADADLDRFIIWLQSEIKKLAATIKEMDAIIDGSVTE